MESLISYVVNVISLGGTYALLALGLAVVFSVLGLINFAHGELMTLTGYVLLAGVLMGQPFWLAVLIAVIAGGVSAALMEFAAFRPVRNASGATLLMTSFAVSMLLQVIFQNGISPRGQAVPVPAWLTTSISVGVSQISKVQIMSITVGLVALIFLKFFFDRSYWGWAIKAAANDFEIVGLMGIKASRLITFAFLLSGLLAGIAGVLWVIQRGSVDPLMGFKPVLAAFIVAVIGGLGSLTGAVFGGFILSSIEIALQTWLPANVMPYREAITYTIVVLILSVFPNGIFGKRVQEKV
jgi:branched-chain amino acid transport system permease protein